MVMKYKKRSLYVLFILVILFGISVGYAAINRTLNIAGNSQVEKNTWDIHFENVQIKNGSVTTTKEPTLDNNNLAIDFSFNLALPGEFYEFSVDIVNNGTIDAMIDSVIKTPELTEEQKKYINYIIEYQNGEEITSKQLVEKDSFVRLNVRVEYREDITEFELPTTTQNLNLGFTLNYIQADSTRVTVKDNGVFKILVDGSLDDIGTVVTIGTEKFYTVGTEGDNVKLLSMYNLYVGGDYDGTVWTAYGDVATGMQDEQMRGITSTQGILKGITIFSNSSSAYSGSLVERYVSNYKKLLERNFDVDIIEARLITTDELISEEIGCNLNGYSCLDAPDFIYLTSYWLQDASDATDVNMVISYGYLGSGHYFRAYGFGVRPLIIVSKEEILGKF